MPDRISGSGSPADRQADAERALAALMDADALLFGLAASPARQVGVATLRPIVDALHESLPALQRVVEVHDEEKAQVADDAYQKGRRDARGGSGSGSPGVTEENGVLRAALKAAGVRFDCQYNNARYAEPCDRCDGSCALVAARGVDPNEPLRNLLVRAYDELRRIEYRLERPGVVLSDVGSPTALDIAKRAMAEIHQALAAVSRVEAVAEAATSRREYEKLRQAWGERGSLEEERHRLAAENERLRELLKRCDSPDGWCGEMPWELRFEIQEALAAVSRVEGDQ